MGITNGLISRNIALETKVILCIVNNSVLLGQLLLCHFESFFESHIFRISSLISSHYFYYSVFKGVSIMIQMIKAYGNIIEENQSTVLFRV